MNDHLQRTLTHRSLITVRYSETDQMGFVYQANYLIWFDIARTELMKAQGCDYAECEAQGLFLPVTKASLHYKAPALFGETVSIDTQASRHGRAGLRFAYSCQSEHGRLLNVGYTEHVFMNAARKPMRLPADIVQLFEKPH